MRDERGFTPSTLEQWTRVIGKFLRWCDKTNRQLRDIQAEDIDAYFVTQATGRWSRVSVANTGFRFARISALRGKAGNVCRQPGGGRFVVPGSTDRNLCRTLQTG